MTQTAKRVPPRHRTLRVMHRLAAVPSTRRALVADLHSIGVAPEVVDEAGIVVSELLGNAMKHAVALPDGRVRVHWQVKSGVVELDVTDGGGGAAPRPLQPCDYATAGRGLRVVRSLGHEWGVVDDERGRTVWATVGGPSRRRRV